MQNEKLFANVAKVTRERGGKGWTGHKWKLNHRDGRKLTWYTGKTVHLIVLSQRANNASINIACTSSSGIHQLARLQMKKPLHFLSPRPSLDWTVEDYFPQKNLFPKLEILKSPET